MKAVVQCSFTPHLLSQDLPKFSDGEERLVNYDFKEEHLALLTISWANNNFHELVGKKII